MTAPEPATRIVVLVSGEGTNLQALIDAQETGRLSGKLVATISNRPGVPALDRARKHGMAAKWVEHTNFVERADFDRELMYFIDEYKADLVVLAGFMRILGNEFIDHYEGRMLNIHPSLLPKYPGLHTHRRALKAGDSGHGATVHFVTRELDGGPGVLQGRLAINPDDTEASLSARVQAMEHKMYPVAVNWFAEKRLVYRAGRAWLDREPLPVGGILWKEGMQ